MPDHEMLDLAAKAAGIEIKTGLLWNPLTDDGDALRLAVNLGINLTFTPEDIYAEAEQFYDAPFAMESWTLKNQDPYAATRRSIVKVAARIGQQARKK